MIDPLSLAIGAAALSKAKLLALYGYVSDQTFDAYVDGQPNSLLASDTNDGRSFATPFATLTAAIAAHAGRDNIRIGIKYGSVFRNQKITVASGDDGWSFAPVGDPALGMPQSLGSSQTAVASFTKSGSVYTLSSHTFDPKTLVLVSPAGRATKLYMTSASGGNSAVLPAAEGDWTYFPATHGTYPSQLKFYSALDLTGYQVEIPQGGAADLRNGFWSLANDTSVTGIAFRFWNSSGIACEGLRARVDSCLVDCPANDGVDFMQAAKDYYIIDTTIMYPGQRWAAGNGPGDGISAHTSGTDFATGTIVRCRLIGCLQAGIRNHSGTTTAGYGNYFQDCYQHISLDYNAGGPLIGSHTHDYNVHVATPNAKGAQQFLAGNVPTGSAVPFKVRNCTFYSKSGTTNPTNAMGLAGAAGEMTNCVIKFGGTTTYPFIMASGNSWTITNTSIHGHSAGTVYNPAGGYVSPTLVNVSTADPLLTDPARGDYSLQAGSPAIDAGVNIGLTTDFAGNPVGASPDRGAYERQAA